MRLLWRRPIPVDVLRDRLEKFHELIAKNNRLLELIAEAGVMLGGEYIFDIQYLRELALNAKAACHDVVDNLNAITRGRFGQLIEILDHLAAEIDAILDGRIVVAPSDHVIPLEQVDSSMVDVVGAKMARLGALRNRLNLDVPDGFVVSTYACQVILEENAISDAIETVFAAPGPYDEQMLAAGSQHLMDLVVKARIPRRIARPMVRHAKKLVRHHRSTTLAVRSSALGEDGKLSFAGQFRTELGVPPERLLDAYRQVVASAFTPEVMAYRQRAGLHPARSLMAVGCLSMVPARAGGVLYTLDPSHPERRSLQVSVTPGLGKTVVEGTAAADRYTLSRSRPHDIEERIIAHKDRALVLSSEGAVELVSLAHQASEEPSVTDDDLRHLAEIGLAIEGHLKCAADVEWVISEQGALQILQARPLRVVDVPTTTRRPKDPGRNHPVVMRAQGEVACSGVAAGPVVVVGEDMEEQKVPDGAVLVARTSTPRLSVAVQHASAVITDVGTSTSHLATIAREYRVPAIVDTGNATDLLAGLDVVTVDADSNIVYAGQLDELLHLNLLRTSSFEDTNEFRILRRMLRRIAPLYLRDPQDSSFTAEACATYHDIIRFAHEMAVRELSEGDWLEPSHTARRVHRLIMEIPLDLVLVDLGGGLDPGCFGHKRVHPQSVTSFPLRALIEGVTTQGVWETDPTRMDPNAFMASATRAPPWLSRGGSRPQSNLAIISRQYLNLNLRIGFHFNIVDCFIGDSRNDNYIFFRFAGGVTELRRRAHRAIMLKRVLEKYDFLVEIKGDLVTARIKKMPRDATLERLRMIGRLIGYSRQLDIMLDSETAVSEHVAKFLNGHFASTGDA